MTNGKRLIAAALGVAALVGGQAAIAKPHDAADTLSILERYAADFAEDQFLQDAMTFGVRVGDDLYTVNASPSSEETAASVSVRPGAPNTPTFVFEIDSAKTLSKLDRGEIHALTLAGKATSADFAPLDLSTMDGFQPPAWFGDKITRLIFHFWIRGTPEIVPFAGQETRIVHGASLGAFYYQPGFRSAWIDIKPGQHANEGEQDTSNPFPTMIILVDGELKALIGDKTMTLKSGEMVLIPAGVGHELINDADKNAKGFLLMFGDGA